MDKIERDYDDIVNGIDSNHEDEDDELESVTSCSLEENEEGEDPKQKDDREIPPFTVITTTTAIPNNNQNMCTSVMNVLLGLTGGDPNRYNSYLDDAVDDDEEDYYDDLQLQVDLANIYSKYITKGIPFGWNNKTLLLEEMGLFHEPLALEHQPLLCLAVLMRLTNLQYRPNTSLVKVFTLDEIQRIYQAVIQVLQPQQNDNNNNNNNIRKTRSHVCLHRMTYFVLKDYLLDAILMQNDTKSMQDINMFHMNTAVIPQALRLLPTMYETESDPIKVQAALETIAQRMKHFTNHNSNKALSALFVAAQQLLERHSASNASTNTELNSSLKVLLQNELSEAKDGGMVYFHALQLRLWMDYGDAPTSEDENTESHQQPVKDDYLGYLRIVGANRHTTAVSPLSCIICIRYIERQLQQQQQPPLPKEAMNEYESFLAFQLYESSEMVVMEAARVIVGCPQTSTQVLEAAVSVLQAYTPTKKLEQRKIKPAVRRLAAQLLERVGLQFLGQLGIR